MKSLRSALAHVVVFLSLWCALHLSWLSLSYAMVILPNRIKWRPEHNFLTHLLNHSHSRNVGLLLTRHFYQKFPNISPFFYSVEEALLHFSAFFLPEFGPHCWHFVNFLCNRFLSSGFYLNPLLKGFSTYDLPNFTRSNEL